MNDFEIFALSFVLPVVFGAVDLWGDRHQNDVLRRVTIVQWTAVFITIYAGINLSVKIPPLSEHLPFATGIIAMGATYAGMRLGLIVGRRLDKKTRERNARAARVKVLNG